MKTRKHVRVWMALSLLFAAHPLSSEAADLKVGDVAPDILGKDIKGDKIRVTSYPGKVLVISFWASWCGPCRKELPMLEQLQRVGADKGLQVVAINWREEPSAFKSIVKHLGEFQLKLVSDSSGKVGSLYGVKGVPHMLLIGKDGKIAMVQIGYGESVIDRLIPAVNEALVHKEAPKPEPLANAPGS
jgi:thiol-disulfide isomerase/thioredoxin